MKSIATVALEPCTGARLSRRDGLYILVFVAVAFTYAVDMNYARYFRPYLVGDAAYYASIAAAWLWPESLATDSFLSDRFLTGPVIAVVHLPLAIVLRAMGFDFLTAYTYPIFPLLIVQAVAFFLVGRIVLGNRLFGAIIALATFIPVYDVTWQVQQTALGRQWFSAAFPVFLLLCLRLGPDPRRWPTLMALLGLGMYVHPVSTPSFALAALIGLIAFRPPAMSLMSLLARLFLAGLAFLATALPFAIVHFALSWHGEIADYETIESLRRVDGGVFVSIFGFVDDQFRPFRTRIILVSGLIGIVLTYLTARPVEPARRFLTVATLALLAVAIGIPLVEQSLSQMFGFKPELMEMARGIRYLAPLSILLAACGIADFVAWRMTKRDMAGQTRRKNVLQTVAVAVVFSAFGTISMVRLNPPYVMSWYQFVPALATIHCWMNARFVCPQPIPQFEVPMIEYLKLNYPPGTKVLPFASIGLGSDNVPGHRYKQSWLASIIRAEARLPISFSDNDRLLVMYGDLGQSAYIYRWPGLRARFSHAYGEFVSRHPDRGERLQRFVAETETKVIVSDLQVGSREVSPWGKVVFSNPRYSIIEVAPTPSPQ